MHQFLMKPYYTKENLLHEKQWQKLVIDHFLSTVNCEDYIEENIILYETFKNLKISDAYQEQVV